MLITHDFWRQVFNGITDPIFVKDFQHKYVLVNDAFCNLMGRRQEELIGKSDYDFFPKQEADLFWQKDDLVFATGIVNVSQEEFTGFDGVNYVTSTTKSLFEEKGCKFLLGVIRDITQTKVVQQRECKLTEEALRRSNAVLQAQQEAAIDGILVVDENFQIITYNRAFIEIWQIPLAVVESGDRQQVLSLVVEKTADSKEFLAKIQHLYKYSDECSRDEVILKDGRILDRYSAPVRSPKGDYYGRVWYFRDITEAKQAEFALRRSNALLKAQQEAAIDGIMVVDENRRLISYNQRFVQLWQLPQEIFANADSPKLIEYVRNELENVEEFISNTNYLYQHPDQSSSDEIILKNGRVFDRYSAPVYSWDGDCYGRVWYYRDITEQKRTEAQLRLSAQELEQALKELQRTQTHLIQSEKMSSLGQLVAGVAHEINNPANFIYANLVHANQYIEDLVRLLELYEKYYPQTVVEVQDFAEEIELDFLKQDLLKMLNSMRVGATRIRQIVLSLRTFSRLDEAELKLVDLHESIDSTLMILQHRLNIQPHRAAIEVIKDYVELPLVECYAGELNQVFMNILTNAIDALEESKKNPQIRIATQLLQANRLLISIADNGVGIPEENQQRIFDPFFTTKPVGKGTGLGLSTSYQIIERHKGQLRCVSTSEGTEFQIEIII